jgi:hypothetical protein
VHDGCMASSAGLDSGDSSFSRPKGRVLSVSTSILLGMVASICFPFDFDLKMRCLACVLFLRICPTSLLV